MKANYRPGYNLISYSGTIDLRESYGSLSKSFFIFGNYCISNFEYLQQKEDAIRSNKLNYLSAI